MANSIKDLNNKVNNEGITPDGRLAAEEWNMTIDYILHLGEVIGSLTDTKIGHAYYRVVEGNAQWVFCASQADTTPIVAIDIPSGNALNALKNRVDNYFIHAGDISEDGDLANLNTSLFSADEISYIYTMLKKLSSLKVAKSITAGWYFRVTDNCTDLGRQLHAGDTILFIHDIAQNVDITADDYLHIQQPGMASSTQDGWMSSQDKVKLDELETGFVYGKIVQLQSFPRFNNPALDTYYDNGATRTDDNAYFKAITRYIAATYNIEDYTIFMGSAVPSSRGIMIFGMYASQGGGIDSETLLPRYCSGMFLPLNSTNDRIIRFGTSNYIWKLTETISSSQIQHFLTTTSSNPIAADVVSAAIQALNSHKLNNVTIVDTEADVNDHIATIPRATNTVWGVIKKLSTYIPIPTSNDYVVDASLLYGIFSGIYNTLFGSLPEQMNGSSLPADPSSAETPTSAQQASVIYRVTVLEYSREKFLVSGTTLEDIMSGAVSNVKDLWDFVIHERNTHVGYELYLPTQGGAYVRLYEGEMTTDSTTRGTTHTMYALTTDDSEPCIFVFDLTHTLTPDAYTITARKQKTRLLFTPDCTKTLAQALSASSGDTRTIYFTNDSHTIVLNGVEYSKSDLKNLEGYFTDDNAKFNYRSTAGSQSVAGQANGDLATIEALYGDSLVWNQMVHTTSYTNTTNVDTTSTRSVRIQYQDTSNTLKGWTGGDTDGKNNVVDNTYYSWRKTASADANGIWRIKVNGLTKDVTVLKTSGWQNDGVIVDVIIPNHVYYIRLRVKTCDSTTVGGVNIDNIQVFDLSLMFGLGKEPTLAEFETFLANYFPRKDYAYNEGEVLSIKSNGIKTVGFNLWDEEWEQGGISASAGEETLDTNRIRSKNYIKVLPSTLMYFYSVLGSALPSEVFFYDADKNFIRYTSTKSFTTSSNCYYIKFRCGSSAYPQTSNPGICINLAWSGNRNGEYEEHWEETTMIPITTLEGTKSDGIREVMFPDGLKGIGDYKDEIKGNKAIKRIAKVDLGTLSWTYNSDRKRFSANPNLRTAGTNTNPLCICTKYAVDTNAYKDAGTNDKAFTLYSSTTASIVLIRDFDYTDAATFKASLQGVYAYCVLETPIEYTLDQDFKVDYKVDDYGTEEILPENGTAPTSLPIIADIRYGINAVDTLARLHKDYVSVYPQSFNDEQKEQARKNIGVNDTLDGNSLDFGVVQNGDGSIDLDLDVSTIGGVSKQKTIELPVATSNHNGLMSKEDKTLLGNLPTAIANDEARLDALDKTYETEGEFGFRHSGGNDIYDVNAGVGRITRLVGNSVNWHQLAPELTSENYSTGTAAYTSLAFSTEQGRKIVTLTVLQSVGERSNNISFSGLLGAGVPRFPANHYYFWTMDVYPSTPMRFAVGVGSTAIESADVSSTTGYTRIYGRSYGDTKVSCRFRVISAVDQGTTLKVKDIQMYDLTMMFGQGKEPTTAQMKTWLETYHRRYDYAREEKIVGFDPKEIVTQGSNLIFDNATVFPNVVSNTMDVVYKGEDITVTIKTRGNNYIGHVTTATIGTTLTEGFQVTCIRVEPNTKYRISLDGEDADKIGLVFYNFLDATYKLLDVGDNSSYKYVAAPNLYFTTSAETYYVKVRLDFRNAGESTYLDVGTYTFRVSLHKEGDGGKNGVVEKYWKKTKALTAPSTLKREDGSLIFPDGLMAIGDYHDEIVDGKAIKRISKVDLGSLDWSHIEPTAGSTTYHCFYTDVLSYIKAGVLEQLSNLTNTRYVSAECVALAQENRGLAKQDKSIMIYVNNRLYLRDDSYTDAASFKTAMSGVYAYYVLNDPEVIEIGDVYYDAYQVDSYGTEMMCDDADGNVDCYGSTKVKYGVNTAEDVGELFLAHANACATAEQNGLMSARDKQLLDLANTPLSLVAQGLDITGQRISRLLITNNAQEYLDAGCVPWIFRKMRVARSFRDDLVNILQRKWVPFCEATLTDYNAGNHYMQVGVPNLVGLMDTNGSIRMADDNKYNIRLVKEVLSLWNYGSVTYDEPTIYYNPANFILEFSYDYFRDYNEFGTDTEDYEYFNDQSIVKARFGSGSKVLRDGRGFYEREFLYGLAFVKLTSASSWFNYLRVSDIMPFKLHHVPLAAVLPSSKNDRWRFTI